MFWKLLSTFRLLLIALGCAAVSACSTNTIPSGAHYIVSVPRTSFYKFGPAQANGPDFSLSEGTRIIMLEHSFGYSRIMTADGTSGYVSTDDVRPAPPGPYTTSPNAKTNYTVQLSRPMFEQPKSMEKHSNVPPNPGSPLFDASDNPLPQGAATPKPSPTFHY